MGGGSREGNGVLKYNMCSKNDTPEHSTERYGEKGVWGIESL